MKHTARLAAVTTLILLGLAIIHHFAAPDQQELYAAVQPAEPSAPAPVHVTARAPRVTKHLTRQRSAVEQVLPSLSQPVHDWRAFTPSTVTVEPLPGLPLDFTAQSIERKADRTTWIGTNPEQGATMVACGTEKIWDAIISVPGANEYSLHITPDRVVVYEVAGGPCGNPTFEADIWHVPTANSQATNAVSPAASLEDSIHYSDLIVLYDAGTLADWGTTEEMINRINLVVNQANVYLQQSNVTNLRWRLVGTAQVPLYPTTQKLGDDLDRLANTNTELGAFADLQRRTFSADQIQLVVAGTRDYAGIAYTPGYLSAVNHPASSLVAAHELAHNFGCRHDRTTEKVSSSDKSYNFGYRFNYLGSDAGTIMAYTDNRLPYFSNPDVSYNGIPLGIAVGQPLAADNARYLREHAAEVENLMPSLVPAAPSITRQPASAAISVGESFTLSITATGNQLLYQWYKDNQPISGANAASYRILYATTANAGSYTVVVSNTAGSATSNAATVTVATRPTSTPNNPGAGGGGGAVGPGAALAVVAILLRQLLRRRN
jgi:hypothetical protein